MRSKRSNDQQPKQQANRCFGYKKEFGMNKVAKNIIAALKTMSLPVILMVVMKLVFPENIGMRTLQNMIYQSVPAAILAWGVSFNMKIGNWDFSVGAAAMISAIVGGNIASMLGLGPVGMLVLCTGVGLLCGCITGTLYYLLKIPTLIISLGMVYLMESLSAIIFNGAGVFITGEYVALTEALPMLGFGAAALAFSIFLFYARPFGYHVRAVGNGAAIAAQEGIDIYKVKFRVLVIASTFAGLYAFATLARTGVWKASSSPMSTMGTCFDAMMCVFIGQALGAATNQFIGIYFGSVTLQMVKLLIILLGIKSTFTQVIISMIVLVFMCISTRADHNNKLQLQKGRVTA